MEKKKVLFVDDKVDDIRNLRQMLEPIRHLWDMDFARGGHEALDIMQEAPASVVVTDMHMKEISGYDLLVEIAKKWPETVRIILSGQLDRGIIYKSIAITHQFLAKPCHLGKLKSTVERACALRELLANEQLKDLVSRVKTLPSLPSIFVQVMEEVRSEEPSVKKIGELISKDIAMSAKILQIVNSAAFGIMRRISNPSEAATLLGLDTLKALVLSVGVFSQFDKSKLGPFSIERVWDHSTNVAVLTRELLRQEDFPQVVVQNSLMIGMLHDVGRLILVENFPKKYKKALDFSKENNVTMAEAEKELFKSTHAELGGYLLALWGLPDQIVEAISYHHSPRECLVQEMSPLTMVHLANAFEHEINPSGVVDNLFFQADEVYLENVGTTEKIDTWRKQAGSVLKDEGGKA